jgi:hypothetical protein
VVEVLGTCLADNVQARELQADGLWARRLPHAGAMTVNAQRLLLLAEKPVTASGTQKPVVVGLDSSSSGGPGGEGGQPVRLRSRRRRTSVAYPVSGDIEVPAEPDI